MIYQSTSTTEMIGKIIRATRLQDMAYIADIKEWIGEAMDMLQTQVLTEGFIDQVKIDFHKGRLPKFISWIDAVEWKGRRLPMGNSVKNIRRPNVHHHSRSGSIEQTWTSEVFKYPAPGNQTYLYFSTLRKVLDHDLWTDHYYEIEMGSILTDFPEGEVTLYCRRVPTDEGGLPMIPDNANYKEALLWYVRGKMIGAGFDDKVFRWQDCDTKFEFYAARAMAEITYPSPNEMQSRIHTLRRLIALDDEYFYHYDRVDHPEGMYDPMGPYPGQTRLGGADDYYI